MLRPLDTLSDVHRAPFECIHISSRRASTFARSSTHTFSRATYQGRWCTLVQEKRGRIGIAASAVVMVVCLLPSGSHASPPAAPPAVTATESEIVCRNGKNNISNDGDTKSDNNNSVDSNNSSRNSILSIYAREAFRWSSTPALAPLSATVVLAQEILANKSALPEGLDSAVLTVLDNNGAEQVLGVLVSPVRDVVSSRVLRQIRKLCGDASSFSPSDVRCDPNEAAPVFGTTPLHLAELWGSRDLVEYLVAIGANPDLYDSAGRQPRDRAFHDFAASSKREAADTRLGEGANSDERYAVQL